jgi:hypothetical protein
MEENLERGSCYPKGLDKASRETRQAIRVASHWAGQHRQVPLLHMIGEKADWTAARSG